MKKKLVVQALSVSIVLSLNGCAQEGRNEKDVNYIKDTQTMSNQNKGHGCSCPHDEEEKVVKTVPNIDSKIKTTDSGLMYEVLKEASVDAVSPKKGQIVTVHYTGWLDESGKNGKKFDSSLDRNQPFQFTIGAGQVIKGWDEGVMSMKVGEKRLLIIPAHLGYGSRGAPGAIPGNATIRFEVELLGTK